MGFVGVLLVVATVTGVCGVVVAVPSEIVDKQLVNHVNYFECKNPDYSYNHLVFIILSKLYSLVKTYFSRLAAVCLALLGCS